MKVLVIEDDPANQELLRLRLEALNCRVSLARTAADGLRMATTMAPELIFLDLRLEHDLLAGVGLLTALRADAATAEVPVVVHSVFVNDPSDLPEGLPAAQAHLSKPFKFQELKAIVERFRPAVVQMPEPEPPAGEPARKGCWWPEAL